MKELTENELTQVRVSIMMAKNELGKHLELAKGTDSYIVLLENALSILKPSESDSINYENEVMIKSKTYYVISRAEVFEMTDEK